MHLGTDILCRLVSVQQGSRTTSWPVGTDAGTYLCWHDCCRCSQQKLKTCFQKVICVPPACHLHILQEV